jgi:predicted RNA binding protein YcfA (HicA-like mRNA interferase family)
MGRRPILGGWAGEAPRRRWSTWRPTRTTRYMGGLPRAVESSRSWLRAAPVDRRTVEISQPFGAFACSAPKRLRHKSARDARIRREARVVPTESGRHPSCSPHSKRRGECPSGRSPLSAIVRGSARAGQGDDGGYVGVPTLGDDRGMAEKYRDVRAALRGAGWVVRRVSGSHEVSAHPDRRRVTLPVAATTTARCRPVAWQALDEPRDWTICDDRLRRDL